MANLKEIAIKYTDERHQWIEQLKQGLDKRDLLYKISLLNTICDSMDKTVMKYLKTRHFFPREGRSYRLYAIKKLNNMGEDITIKTNKTLWLYVEYFLDITDYSKCFDINIIKLDRGDKSETN